MLGQSLSGLPSKFDFNWSAAVCLQKPNVLLYHHKAIQPTHQLLYLEVYNLNLAVRTVLPHLLLTPEEKVGSMSRSMLFAERLQQAMISGTDLMHWPQLACE